MHRALTAALGAATIALPTANAVAAVENSTGVSATPKKTVVTRKVSGPAAEADRWGTVQINVTVRKTTIVVKGVRKVTRRIVDIGGTFSYHTDRSLYIMQQALPLLRQQALQSMSSSSVDMISGATYTSEAFVQSLQEALVKANKV
jgi:uncharacterized protein with FMN-binding domain